MDIAERHSRVSALFQVVRDLPAEEQAEELNSQCGDDPTLRAEVEAMLAAELSDPEFLERPAITLDRVLGRLSDQWPGDLPEIPVSTKPLDQSDLPPKIGKYAILARLGEGGSAHVYLATQESPVRQVALKVLKPGISSRESFRRLQFEAAILARMQHPAIAQIFESDVADHGRGPQPYFAMELVAGEPLNEYCARMSLGTRQRLVLLAEVCDGIEHAHQKGIIHRDLKPSNILIDAQGRPKVLDFGIAKATDCDLYTTTLQTDIGQLLGTVPYMSPEQTLGDPAALDTRSDVYSWGVVSYETLTGHLPYSLEKRPIHESIRTIREVEPIRPSTRDRMLKGDVETILLKAIEKDPQRRYQTISDASQDIRRYLRDEPIAARRSSLVYQFRKFAKRRSGLVASAVLVGAALVAGGIGTTWQAYNARHEARKLRASLDFLHSMLQSPDPMDMGPNAKVVDMLNGALSRIDAHFANVPDVAASVRRSFAETYEALGQYDEAEAQVRHAIGAYESLWGPAHPETLDLIGFLALVLLENDKLDESQARFQQALDGMNATRGAHHRETLITRHNLALLFQQKGDYESAEQILREVLDVQQNTAGISSDDIFTTLNSLSVLLRDTDRLEEAQSLQATILDQRRRALGSEHPETLSSMHNVGVFLSDSQKLEEAESVLSKVVRARQRVLGPTHPQTLESANALAGALYRQKKLSEAESIFREVAEVRARSLGEEHYDTLIALNNLATVVRARGSWHEARQIYERVVSTAIVTIGESHPNTCIIRGNLGLCLTKLTEFSEAERHLLAAHECLARAWGEDHVRTKEIAGHLAALYDLWEKPQESAKFKGQPETEE